MSVESRGGRAQGGRGQEGRQARHDRGPREHAGARPPRGAAVTELTRLLEPAVRRAGFDLEEVDVRPAGRRRLVRVVVDGDDGVGLDDIARLSETASALLDESDAMGASPYVLEVTSPGVDRPLTEPRHWRRAVGRLVVAPLAEGGQIEGRVIAADGDGVEIDVVQKRRGRGAGAKDGGGSAGSAPASGGAGGKSRQKGRTPATETVRRRFRLGELGRGRVQVEFKPLSGGSAGPSPQKDSPSGAEEPRSPAEPE
ncbi:ribosome maturation factor RimP [Actinomadura sp. GC306]|uniref:ribosome maturation factor RimP n=1 Tax=Actinomadura sp. GC306 TaxID=2530367 RepID=UPI001047C7F4|nr:ribosome maturation factor RimP [Actinomadura sp. GC306]TDC64654.1 ribosome maturation factor RimP [Actinomadura sp. GC306]